MIIATEQHEYNDNGKKTDLFLMSLCQKEIMILLYLYVVYIVVLLM